jgi:hypothetical protein
MKSIKNFLSDEISFSIFAILVSIAMIIILALFVINKGF